MEQSYRFYRESNGNWYADLPNYPGPKGDLLMVEGADTMLENLANGGSEVNISASLEPFEGADKLELVKKASGGGDYILKDFQGQTINHAMWLCSVIKFVYGKVPKVIYVKF